MPAPAVPVYCRVKRGTVHSVREFVPGVVVDLDRDGRALGVEVTECVGLEVDGRAVRYKAQVENAENRIERAVSTAKTAKEHPENAENCIETANRHQKNAFAEGRSGYKPARQGRNVKNATKQPFRCGLTHRSTEE